MSRLGRVQGTVPLARGWLPKTSAPFGPRRKWIIPVRLQPKLFVQLKQRRKRGGKGPGRLLGEQAEGAPPQRAPCDADARRGRCPRRRALPPGKWSTPLGLCGRRRFGPHAPLGFYFGKSFRAVHGQLVLLCGCDVVSGLELGFAGFQVHCNWQRLRVSEGAVSEEVSACTRTDSSKSGHIHSKCTLGLSGVHGRSAD